MLIQPNSQLEKAFRLFPANYVYVYSKDSNKPTHLKLISLSIHTYVN